MFECVLTYTETAQKCVHRLKPGSNSCLIVDLLESKVFTEVSFDMGLHHYINTKKLSAAFNYKIFCMFFRDINLIILNAIMNNQSINMAIDDI